MYKSLRRRSGSSDRKQDSRDLPSFSLSEKKTHKIYLCSERQMEPRSPEWWGPSGRTMPQGRHINKLGNSYSLCLSLSIPSPVVPKL